MKKKVLLTSNINHYNHTARALQEIGVLDKYISGIQFSDENLFMKLFSDKHKKYLSNFIDKGIEPDKLVSYWELEIIYKLFLKYFKNNKVTIIKAHNFLFDLLTKRYITDKHDYLHFVSSVGGMSALKAKRKGAKIIVDERAQHPVFMEKLLNEEMVLLGMSDTAESIPLKDSLLKEYELADYFIVSSQFAKRTFVENGINPEKIYVVPYGYDSQNFKSRIKQDNIFRVIFVGQIIPRKGVIYLLDAFKRMPNHNTELLLIGKIDEKMKPYFEDVPHNIRHIPYIPNHELVDYYSDSSVFVLPSISDAFGLVVLEAMGTGLPVIVTNNVGAADVIEDGKEGFIVPIRDSEAIYNKLMTLYTDDNLIEIMSNNSRAKVEEFTWEKYCNRLQNVYLNIMKEDTIPTYAGVDRL